LPDAYIVLAKDENTINTPADGIPVANDPDMSDGEGALNISFGEEMCVFSGLAGNKTFYFEIYPYTNAGTNVDYKNDGTAPATTETTPFVLIYQDFDNNWGFWDTVNVLGDEVWDRDNTFGIDGTPCAQMSGFSGSANENEDWLISPPMNLDAFNNEVLTFFTAMNYTGPDLEPLISSDYDGGGDPSTATWDELTWTMSPGSWEWTSSGNIDLSGISGTAVYLAFKFTSTTAGSATWEVDNVLVIGEPSVGLPGNELPVEAYRLYPNPSNGMVKIEGKISEKVRIDMLTVNGSKVRTITDVTLPANINMQDLKPGIYFLRITDTIGNDVFQRLVIY
jgi:hypothetical protein